MCLVSFQANTHFIWNSVKLLYWWICLWRMTSPDPGRHAKHNQKKILKDRFERFQPPSLSLKQRPPWSSSVSLTTLSEFQRLNQMRVSPWWPHAGTKSGKFEKSMTRPLGNSFHTPSKSLNALTLKARFLNFCTKLEIFRSFRSLPTVMRRAPVLNQTNKPWILESLLKTKQFNLINLSKPCDLVCAFK